MDGFALWLASEAIANSDELHGIYYGLISRQSNPTDEAAFIANLNQKLASSRATTFVRSGSPLRGVTMCLRARRCV